ncbi:MAG: RNA 3'-terminal phosphate cyclase [Candidatus Aenigmatarchaeota archaeon]
MIEIDGSHGEGGGQILRTAIALSAITGKPCKVYEIRANRSRPGLQAQHLAALNAVGKLCNAEIIGNELGSTEIEFIPHEIKGGSLSINVGTAGSTALVLQALLIPAFHCKKPLDISITGGTLNKWAPSIYYLQNITLTLFRKLGCNAEIILHKHGFYPKGGGIVEAKITPSTVRAIELIKSGKVLEISGLCLASEDLQNDKVAERMQKVARQGVFREFQLSPKIKTEYAQSESTGCGIDIIAVCENTIIGANAIGEPGKRAEKVATEALAELIEFHSSDATLDKHMADQIIPYMALGTANDKKESMVKVVEITEHTRTNVWVVEKFLSVKFEINEKEKTISCK